ncbi:hypothetical protein HMPREF0063_12587 [Aeromicrobium marinum DSM 15272]|uniref:HPr kinase/phosphorylase C-terminal domain-containing protein n=2 Tax=Aeromicrobium marinum TaxID=219314 RepID=E2SEX8_9ACTN|nr:hypothetical protein HMPREF0063_12587 [Aeromicrobium marinum DSM 15272]
MYSCFGITVDSSIPLPDLEGAGPGATADVTVRERPVEARPAAAVRAVPGLWWHRGEVWLEAPGTGRFVARDGSTVVVEREPGVSDGDVRIFVLGTMLGAILRQRGHLVLHGNAFDCGASAAIVVGHSGAGKSTLAAELDRRGLPVLSDDVVPIDAAGVAAPGYPRIKLWADALQDLGLDTAGFERITDGHDKFHVPLSRSGIAPLAAEFVYVLETHDRPSLELSEVTGMAAYEALRTHTYRGELLVDPADEWQHLRQCADLAARARIVRVVRPAATMTAAATADAILADIAGTRGLRTPEDVRR